VSEVEYRNSRLIFASPQVSLFWWRCGFLNSHILGGWRKFPWHFPNCRITKFRWYETYGLHISQCLITLLLNKLISSDWPVLQTFFRSLWQLCLAWLSYTDNCFDGLNNISTILRLAMKCVIIWTRNKTKHVMGQHHDKRSYDLCFENIMESSSLLFLNKKPWKILNRTIRDWINYMLYPEDYPGNHGKEILQQHKNVNKKKSQCCQM